MQDLSTIPMRDVRARIATISVAMLAAIMAYFGAAWQLGDMLARLTSATDDQAAVVADAALRLAPSDPYANALRAEIGQDQNSPDARASVEMAEHTVRLSPNDHRWHIALARALATDG